MQKTLLAASLAAVIGMGGSAYAADIYSGGSSLKDAPAVMPDTSWTGFYVGVGIGAGMFDDNLKSSLTYHRNNDDPSAGVDGLGGEGIFGTVQVGYDKQFGRWVGGIFFDYDFSNINSKISIDSASWKVNLNDMWSAGGRLGYLVNNDTLVYVLGAYTQANFGLPSGLRGGDRDGYSVGGGIETHLSGNWFLKGEYRFTSLGTETIFDKSTECYTLKVTDQSDIQTARLVLSYKADIFGRDVTPLK
jgi:outer membrane immunogenic protein